MGKQYTSGEEQRIGEIFKELEASFNSWGPMLEELFDIYDDYNDNYTTILQHILRVMNELNYVEAIRGLKKNNVPMPWEGDTNV